MGVNINVLNQSLRRIAVVDDYTSLIWAKRYYDVGAIDLQIEATAKNLELFRKYNYITRDDDDAVYRIEALELDTSVENTNYIIVGAYDCKKILNQRIVWNQLNFKGTVENFIRKIITDNIISPVNSQRRINNFRLKAARGFTEQIESQTTYDNLSEKITELCIANGYGWRVTLEGGAWYFDLYKGEDRSLDQSTNPHVVFSPDYDNLTSTKYTMDANDYRNVALVAGEGEGVQRKTRTIGNAAGINRFEAFIESNVSSNTEEGDLVDYYEALVADGKAQLAEKAVTTTFEGEIDTNFYKYKQDYNLGDIVTVMNEYGIKVNARVVEVAETWDSEGYSIDPVFEYMEMEEAEITGVILTENREMLRTESDGVLLTEAAERSVGDTSSKKISELPIASSVGDEDIIPIVQEGETRGIPASALKGDCDFDLVYPIGCTYTQYPKQKSPTELWGNFSTWEIIDYGGAFFRAGGGNADGFDTNVKRITAVSGNTITIANHNAGVGTIIYDFDNNESRVVTAVSANVLTLDSQFTNTNLRNVLIGQAQSAPNVTGAITCGSEGLFNGRGTISASGCFTVSGSRTYAGGDNADSGRPATMNLDLSKSNATYGRRNEIAANNFTKIVWVRTA